MSAEIAVNPRANTQIYARYGLDEAAYRGIFDDFSRRFASDKALYTRYMELFQQYREWLARTPR